MGSLKGQSEEAGSRVGESWASCHWANVFRGGG